MAGQGGQAVPPPYRKEITSRHACLPAFHVMSCAMPVSRERVALYSVASCGVWRCWYCVPGWNRICAVSLAIVFACDDEIGGIGIAGNYCFG